MTETPCALCGEPHETICDRCTREICYGCLGDDLCVECELETQEENQE